MSSQLSLWAATSFCRTDSIAFCGAWSDAFVQWGIMFERSEGIQWVLRMWWCYGAWLQRTRVELRTNSHTYRQLHVFEKVFHSIVHIISFQPSAFVYSTVELILLLRLKWWKVTYDGLVSVCPMYFRWIFILSGPQCSISSFYAQEASDQYPHCENMSEDPEPPSAHVHYDIKCSLVWPICAHVGKATNAKMRKSRIAIGIITTGNS